MRANRAVVIIQSFADDPMSLAEFMGFIGLLIPNHSGKVNELIGPVEIDRIELFFAWLDHT